MREGFQRTDSCVPKMIVLAALLSLAVSAHGFAYEETSVISFFPEKSTDDSEFGFSLAYFENEERNEKKFLVGSPSNDDNMGALYICSVEDLNSSESSNVECPKVSIKDKYVNTTFESKCTSDAHDQRIGAALAVSDKQIIVCAPNWKNTCRKQSYSPTTSSFYNTLVGTCYTSSDVLGPFTNFTPVYYYNTQPPRRYYLYDGLCQAGFSVALTRQDSGGVVLGAPGCLAWLGDVFWADIDDPTSLKRKNSTYVESQLVQNSDSNSYHKPTDRYMGYTVAEGIFAGQQMVVSSSPKETMLNNDKKPVSDAATYILSRNDKSTLIIWTTLFHSESEWKFAYCGFSLVVVDFNLDGLDDVAVGCPNYHEDRGAFVIFFQKKTEAGYEMEREYDQCLNKNNDGSVTFDCRVGQSHSERFASSMAAIGDMDDDGFPDFAVGAPGADDNRGRVYIFCGEALGLSEEPCQVLKAADNSHKGLGWALTSGSGFLAVSRTNPHTVAVYRRRKVLMPQLQVITDTSLPPVGVQDVPVQVCLNYDIRNGDLDSTKRKFEGHLELDVGKDMARLQFNDLEASIRSRIFVIEAQAGERKCADFRVRRKMEEDDGIYYELKANASLLAERLLTDVVDPRHALEAHSTLRRTPTCNDTECITEVMVTMQHEALFYTYETSNSLYLNMSVAVSKDPAYVPKLHVDTGGDLSYSAVQGSQGVTCQGRSDFYCNFDVLENSKADLVITLQPSQELKETNKEHPPEFIVTANFSSSSNFSVTSKPTATLRIPVHLNVQLDLAGWKSVDAIEKDQQEEVFFTFELINRNTYSYTVTFKVTQTNATNLCINSTKLLKNDSCSCIPESCDAELLCVYKDLAANMKQTVNFSAVVEGKEGCQSPLLGVALFSDLPFNIDHESVMSATSFTLREVEEWYTKWWMISLMILLVLVLINIVFALVYYYKKANQKKNEESKEDENEAENEELAENDDDDEDDLNAVELLNPEKNNP